MSALNSLLKIKPKQVKADDIVSLWRKLNPTAPPRPYVDDHANRFATSVNDLVPLVRKPRVLDIAGNQLSKDIFSKYLKSKDYLRSPKTLDIEIDDWFEPGSEVKEDYYDLALLTEVIEHMSADPAHVLCSANRALKDSGIIYLTTPNIASARGLYNLIHGHAPYHWGVLFGKRGDRHQREYAPHELEYLVAANGFETAMWTVDMYPRTEYHDLADTWLEENVKNLNSSLLGDTIVVVGRKVSVQEAPVRVSPIYDASVSESADSEKLKNISVRLGKFFS